MSSLTFGPGWLRALSGGDTAEAQSKPAGMKRFKLAEFRYGREEMLALFVDNAKMPKELKDFGDIILQETLSEPLSFIPLTEEEERCQVAGVNSAVVLRMSGRGAPPVRGRGAIRGARGRGRGEGQPGYYRSLSNEDSGYNNSREPYARRPWAEGSRGGSSDRGAGRGDPSLGRGGFEPRARIPSDRAGSTEREPWRPGQEEDDGGGWRISGQRSWRKGSADASRNWRSDHSKEESGDPAMARRSWNRSNSEKEEGGNYWRHASTSSNSGLPEWCDDDDDQDLGTFDSSGQFKSLRDQKDAGQNHDKNADATDSRFSRQESDPPVFDSATDKDSEDWDGMEEAGKKQDGKTNRSSEMNDKSKINVSRDWDSGPPRGLTKEPERGSSKERSRMSPREAGQGPHNGSDQREQNQRVDTASKTSPLPEAEDSKSVPISVSELEKQLLSGNDSGKKSVNTVNSNKIDDLTIDDVKSVAHDMRKILAESHMARTVPPGNDDEEADLDMDHIKNLIDKLDDENDDPFAMQVTSPMQEVANRNIDDPSIVFAKKAEPGVLIKGMQDWIYRDPQGEIQGPFSCEEMLQWFKAGYFTMGLLVRRVCDEIFLPLGDLIKLWNRVPFLPGREPPSVTSQVYAAQLARRQQQEQYLLAQQQRKMQQQQQQQHQQIQQQQQQHELRLLQQMQEQQQMKDMQQRPHNLNVGQEVSIWGDSPAPSPNLASTPWSPSTSQPEPQAWNDSKSPTANLEEFKKHEIDKERAEKLSGLEPKKSSSEDLKRLADEEEPAKGKPNEAEREPSDEYKGGLSPSDDELELADDDDSQLKEQNKKKSKGKKKKGANDKKKEEREKQQRREEEDRKALEALEKAQQEKIAIQKRKEEEERQKQILMQQQQLKQQQQQQILQQQQQQQQQQLKHQQMLMQQQAMMQQEQRRLNVNEGPSWNVPTSSNAPSLAEIQRMEEERQMIIREKLKQLQAHEQQIQQQQRAAAGWAEKGSKPVQSLRQIQEEEARQMLARQRNQVQHQQQPPKGGHGAVSSTVWNSKNVQSQQNYGGYDTQGGSASFWDDVMNLAPSLETSSQYQRSNSKSRVVSDSGFPSLNSGAKQNKKSKDEELVHRLFHQANPCDEFIQWVNKNMPGITKFVDVPTFVGFLQDIDSPYEVHEYIRSYFGENQDAQNFAREFLEWRKRNGRQPTSQYGPVSSSGMSIMSQNSDPAGLDGDDPTGRKKKQKKRMQKVNPSLLGFSCDADPGMVNRGAIQSAMDAWNSK